MPGMRIMNYFKPTNLEPFCVSEAEDKNCETTPKEFSIWSTIYSSWSVYFPFFPVPGNTEAQVVERGR